MADSGVIPLLSFSPKEHKLLVELLMRKVPNADLIYEIFGDEFIYIFDAMAGENLKFPSRVSLQRNIVAIKIYIYCLGHGFSDDSVLNASHIFHRSVDSVRKTIAEFKSLDEEVYGNGKS